MNDGIELNTENLTPKIENLMPITANIIKYNILTLLILCYAVAVNAQEEQVRSEKQKVISLVEDELAGAWTIPSSKDNPCFGTLDRIYPDWHGGKPAEARRKWTFHNYEGYNVSYTVYSVDFNQPGLAVLKGKKKVTQRRMITFSIFPPEMKTEKFWWNFSITCHRLPSGDWQITKETLE